MPRATTSAIAPAGDADLLDEAAQALAAGRGRLRHRRGALAGRVLLGLLLSAAEDPSIPGQLHRGDDLRLDEAGAAPAAELATRVVGLGARAADAVSRLGDALLDGGDGLGLLGLLRGGEAGRGLVVDRLGRTGHGLRRLGRGGPHGLRLDGRGLDRCGGAIGATGATGGGASGGGGRRRPAGRAAGWAWRAGLAGPSRGWRLARRVAARRARRTQPGAAWGTPGSASVRSRPRRRMSWTASWWARRGGPWGAPVPGAGRGGSRGRSRRGLRVRARAQARAPARRAGSGSGSGSGPATGSGSGSGSGPATGSGSGSGSARAPARLGLGRSPAPARARQRTPAPARARHGSAGSALGLGSTDSGSGSGRPATGSGAGSGAATGHRLLRRKIVRC